MNRLTSLKSVDSYIVDDKGHEILKGQSSETFQRGSLTYVTARNPKNYYPIS